MNEETATVGVLGGSFNPVHLGHLIVAQDALECFDLREVWFMPCARPPHKPDDLAEARHRAQMIELAIETQAAFRVCAEEVDRGGISYTIDTLNRLSDAYPDEAFRFIIGADSVPELHSWRSIDELFDRYGFLVMGRPGFDPAGWTPESLGLKAEQVEALKHHLCRAHAVGISSSDIRRRAAEGWSIKYLAPAEVEMYIMEHHLYG